MHGNHVHPRFNGAAVGTMCGAGVELGIKEAQLSGPPQRTATWKWGWLDIYILIVVVKTIRISTSFERWIQEIMLGDSISLILINICFEKAVLQLTVWVLRPFILGRYCLNNVINVISSHHARNTARAVVLYLHWYLSCFSLSTYSPLVE